ncbi:MAG: hypothetical protein EOQ52_20595 [Mesorhizobium sp.]|uniref:phage regulatory CII family protein n=1 Tax=Mesorhizobium sp. TaxID=1871066 RepID=UPI000FE4633A|nr:phage regulatory CII family protein [Mesorhizobium sp.]RWB85950.1 MAG: hypothetical protein EOQ52_20595 [Mesorhizobium sp.]
MNLIARLARIKAAQAELISRAGGIDGAVATLETTGRSTIGRWNNADDPTLMSLDALIRLEAATGSSCMTAALAEMNGRRLADRDAEAAQQVSVMSRHAEAILQAGELMAAGAAAFADGKVSPNEAAVIDRAAAQLERGLAEYRKALAGIRASGGLSVVSGGN